MPMCLVHHQAALLVATRWDRRLEAGGPRRRNPLQSTLSQTTLAQPSRTVTRRVLGVLCLMGLIEPDRNIYSREV